MMRIERIHAGDPRLAEFIDHAGDSLMTFRYFRRRPLSVISKHLVTMLGLNDETVVAYGHLEQEDRLTWLGICVTQSERGKGYGKEMMKELLLAARRENVGEIHLTVDVTNNGAHEMYRKFGFVEVSTNNEVCHMKRSLSDFR